MDIKRLRHLAGITEAMEVDMDAEREADMDMDIDTSDEASECSGSVCPFCGTKVPHGTLVEHIKNEHADMIALYKEMHGEDEEYDDTTDVEATEFPEDL